MNKLTQMLLVAVIVTLSVTTQGCGKAPKGDTGVAGKDGQSTVGATGSQGPVGPQGAPGVDAHPVTVVKLCPATTVYSTTFTEVAFCIDGSLYAVYSANGGFESLIPPGTYSSNGINSSCTFTVHANCEVTQ